MFAKNLRAMWDVRFIALSLATFASKLAPTKYRQASNPAHCRSELAREKPEGNAGSQVPRVIVNDLREQARSYMGSGLLAFGLGLRHFIAQVNRRGLIGGDCLAALPGKTRQGQQVFGMGQH